MVWLKHHWEAKYIISGAGEVTDLTRGEKWPLEAGVLYVVGPNDRHRLHLTTDECHLSIFHPPLKGDERFDEDGAYDASGPVPVTDRRMFVKRVDDLRRAGGEEVSDDGKMRTLELLGAADDVGFNCSEVRLGAGAQVVYRDVKHRQANHIISGSAEVSDLAAGRTWPVGPGMAYTVGPGDRTCVRAHADTHLLSVMSSSLQGD